MAIKQKTQTSEKNYFDSVEVQDQSNSGYIGAGAHTLECTGYQWVVGSNPGKPFEGPVITFKVLETEDFKGQPTQNAVGEEVAFIVNRTSPAFRLQAAVLGRFFKLVFAEIGYEGVDTETPFNDIHVEVEEATGGTKTVALGTALSEHETDINELLVGMHFTVEGTNKDITTKAGRDMTVTRVQWTGCGLAQG